MGELQILDRGLTTICIRISELRGILTPPPPPPPIDKFVIEHLAKINSTFTLVLNPGSLIGISILGKLVHIIMMIFQNLIQKLGGGMEMHPLMKSRE